RTFPGFKSHPAGFLWQDLCKLDNRSCPAQLCCREWPASATSVAKSQIAAKAAAAPVRTAAEFYPNEPTSTIRNRRGGRRPYDNRAQAVELFQDARPRCGALLPLRAAERPTGRGRPAVTLTADEGPDLRLVPSADLCQRSQRRRRASAHGN